MSTTAHRTADTNSPADAMPAPLNLWRDERPVPSWVQDVARGFDVDGLVDVIIGRCLGIAFPNHIGDDEFRAHLTASTRANAHCLRSVIAGDIALEDVYLEQVLSFATVQAQLRIPQKSMQRSYRVSFFTMWEAWTAFLRQVIVERDIDRDEAALAMQLLTQTILGYQDFVASQVAETYTRDYEALNRSRAHMRRNLVKEILRGEGNTLAVSDTAILSYDLSCRHIAVLLPTLAEGAATQLSVGMRAAVSCQHSLVYPLTLSSTVVWLGRIGEWKPAILEALDGVLREAGVVATLGGPSVGIDGFRESLEEAMDAERIRAAWGDSGAPAVVRHDDVGLEILLMRDPDRARQFVERELGPLARDTVEAARLRETLEASFRFGSHVAAAEHLQLHEHTVRNRLHKVEELIGRPLAERRTELQVAARLVRLLPAIGQA
ncbi:helix-turn-helix domain-containing protein [Mycolicibacterium smegmatis]|uniref:PucR family transcriptional regulator n=1 Tax=Mycolicibacterium smegmatis TaxID=1772 RepID=UPI0005D754CB|nr:PucR family transcriptional regulator [Mycolicibacterium smegmatis]MCP2628270.1 helix-turn-helix domain-containing protein [Mycolicibacterium smegmatis]MDF1897371.1 helix-turn-helix domain-containing protein [Mycolicibacterium smegmatis]MDF1904186.1 helix-turn-helix domain-containing protein [Mycolicibacterium smegmatis]MDF1916937.1 helix-turn-helix domain-containing protein [Mycolicibacterium smegmatis]MDF1922311.1 helix-turn-helix domain-containing protein [Mycolicibacterium smegmatis]